MNSFLGMLLDEKLLLETEKLHQIGDKQGLNLRALNYRVLIISSTCEISSVENYQKYCLDVPKYCSSFFSDANQQYLLEHDYAGKCIVLLMDNTRRKATEQTVFSLIQYLDKHQFADTVIAVGKQVDTLTEAAYSYRTAMNALSYRSLYSGERCLFCEDMQTMLQLSTLQSIVDPNHMLRLFQQGELGKLRETVTAYAERVRRLSGDSIEGRHPTSIRRMFVELTVYVLHVASDMGINVDELLNGIDPYNFLLYEEQATPVIIDWFMDFCIKIRHAIDEKSKSKERTVIQTVCDYINEHIMQNDLNLDDVSAVVNMTPSYLSKLFHKEMNIGFSKYIIRRRLEISKALLIETNMPIKQIAMKAGFASANYFGTVFKKMENISPNAYRTLNKSASD